MQTCVLFNAFIKEELDTGHFNGPVSIDEVHVIFGGQFWTMPLGFVENPGSLVLWVIHHHSKEDSSNNQPTAGWIL